MASPPPGRLEAIWIKRGKRGPMDPRDSARLVAERGLVDNANQGGHRQVTLIEAEKWQRVEAELGREVDPTARRANLMIRGVDLADSRNRVLAIGDCRIQLVGETRPCRLMEETVAGLQRALDPDWRGGAYGRVLSDGEIAVGDPVRFEEPEA
jgi:MOSC domain-containing protein YiiM